MIKLTTSIPRNSPKPDRTTSIAIVSNTSWSLVNFRSGLIKSMVNAGFYVYAIAPTDEYSCKLADLGAHHVDVSMDKGGTNPLRDFGLFLQLWSTFRSIRPKVVLGFTAKPNIYGGMAAHFLGIPVINNIAGLGAAFSRDSRIRFFSRISMINSCLSKRA
jgi:hypothetical protein